MQNVAIGWQVYGLTGQAMDLGWLGLAQFIPFVLLVLFAGHFADRHDRRRILSLCFGAVLVCSVLLLIFTWNGLTEVWPVFAVMLLYGGARAFMMPVTQVLVVNLVPAEAFSKALAYNTSAFQVAVVTGPAVGGLLYLAGPDAVYAVAAVLLALAVMLIARLPRVAPADAARRPANLREFTEGLRFVGSRPTVLGAISLDLFAVLFGGATALLPAFASDVLHVGPVGLGLLRAAPGIGAVLMGLWLSAYPIQRRAGWFLFGGVAVYGLASIAFGASTVFAVSVAALGVMGAADMVSVYVRQMLVQLATPDAIRGRVSAVNAVFIGASNELGEFESGLAAASLGLVPSVLFGGAATLLVAAIWMLVFPALRRMDGFPRATHPATRPEGKPERHWRHPARRVRRKQRT